MVDVVETQETSQTMETSVSFASVYLRFNYFIYCFFKPPNSLV